jgi:hypothetical protein
MLWKFFIGCGPNDCYYHELCVNICNNVCMGRFKNDNHFTKVCIKEWFVFPCEIDDIEDMNPKVLSNGLFKSFSYKRLEIDNFSCRCMSLFYSRYMSVNYCNSLKQFRRYILCKLISFTYPHIVVFLGMFLVAFIR